MWLVAGVLCCAGLSSSQQVPPASAAMDMKAQAETKPERPVFVSIPSLLKPLKRAQVLFSHDKHAETLKAEGCETCHPRKAGVVEFSFPKSRNESSRKALTASYHDACIKCHAQRSGLRKPAGPVTCGECHSDKKAARKIECLPALPPNCDGLRDPNHKDCIACHSRLPKSTNAAGNLDWKTFHVRSQDRGARERPAVVYDYYVHDKHVAALDKKCELCHYISPALKEKLAAGNKVPTSQDWLREEETGQSLKQKEPAHRRCINCHLARIAEKKTHGPVDCRGCHSERKRTPAELEKVQLPDYDKKDRILIGTEDASLKTVPFDHKAHIEAGSSCGSCHHDALEACDKCHTIKGSKAGEFITLAEAYHKSGSKWSCVGCHDQEKARPDCAGCHSLRRDGLAATKCDSCHTGTLESLDGTGKLPDPASLFPEDLKDELEISLLSKEFEATMVKHKNIARRLTDISNGSKLATFFHRQETTICAGCHHLVPIEKQKNVPSCSACHSPQNTPAKGSPALVGAYHQQCLGCHRQMGYPEEKMPQTCTGCHKEKKAISK